MTLFTRLLPTVVSAPIVRRGVLGAAGLAFGAGLLAGPATAAQAAPVEHRPVAVVQTDKSGDKAADKSADRSGDKAADRAGKGRDLKVDYQAQPNFYYCGPAASRNALTTMDKDVSQDEMAKIMGTTEAGTDSAHDITRGLNKVLGKDVYRTTEIPGARADEGQTKRLAEDIRASVDAGRGVVANIAGTALDTEGGVHSFEGGHYIAVTGYADEGRVATIADSANPNTAAYQISTEALADWIATRGYSH